MLERARAPAMRPVLDLAQRAARSFAPVLIRGETGTGKRSLARWIHGRGPRRAGPLVTVASAAIDEAVRAGAGRARMRALFDDARGGTLVIDEIVELSPEAQAALVDLLDQPGLRPHATSGTRVIATTQHDARSSALRGDLYYAIAVISIAMPPLRERAEDIPALVASVLARASRRGASISAGALAVLARAAWPGNVRELEAAIERAVALSDDGAVDVVHLAELTDVADPGAGAAATSPDRRGRRSYRR